MMRRLLATAVLIVTAAEVRAQDPATLVDLSLEELGAIEVTSVSKQPEQVWHTPVAIHVITQEDIRRSGATSLPELLRLAPGVEVARIDSDHWAVGVRGFGDQFSKSLLVMIDGRSIYTPLFAGMYWPAHDTLVEDVERIEIIRGPGGTIWGSNAVNGVINIITRSTVDTAGTLATVAAGSHDRSAAVRYGAVRGAGSYRVYLKGVSRAAQFHADGADFDEWWMGQAGGRADWAGAAQRFTLQGEVSRGEHGQRVNVGSFVPPFQRAVDGPLDANGGHVLARWEREFSASSALSVQGYFDRTDWLAPHFGETRNTVDLDVIHRLALGARHGITWGGGARWSSGVFTQVVPTLDFSPREQADSISSAFAQDEVMLARDRLWLTAGSKLEHNSYTGLEVQPGVRLLWMPRPAHTFWTAVTRAVRIPSRIERGVRATSFVSTAANGVPIFLQAVGNDAVGAERLLGYEVGYRTLVTPRVYLDVAAFHNDHDDLGSFGLGQVSIETSPRVHGLVRFPYVNGLEGTSHGFEVSPDWRPATWWQLKGSYSYLTFDLRTTPASVDSNAVARFEGSSPHHQVRLQSHIAPTASVDLAAAYRYVSALPARNAAAYHTLDTRLAWRPVADLELFVVGQNLLQPQHVEFGHAAGPAVGISRAAYGGVTWRRASGRR